MPPSKLEFDFEIKTSAEKFYRIFRSSAHHLPNVCPEKVSAINVHKGDWESMGSVKHWDFVFDGKPEYAKETIEAVDDENKTITFDVFEGDEVSKYYKNFKVTIQAIDKADGGALVKWTLQYEKVNQNVPPPYKYKDLAASMTKGVEAHFLKA